jgi:hypothetical protein
VSRPFNNIAQYPEKTIDLPQVTDNLYHINRDRSPCNFVYIKIDYILSKFSLPLSTLWHCCFEIYSYYYKHVLMSFVLRWSNILYKVRALNDMFLCIYSSFWQYSYVITAMVGWSYSVNMGMLFTIFTSVHTQRNMSFNARTLYRMFDQRKTNDISTCL